MEETKPHFMALLLDSIIAELCTHDGLKHVRRKAHDLVMINKLVKDKKTDTLFQLMWWVDPPSITIASLHGNTKSESFALGPEGDCQDIIEKLLEFMRDARDVDY